jgi:hypothetical protein
MSLDEGSARIRDLHLTTHDNHKDIHTPGRIVIHVSSKRAAADLPALSDITVRIIKINEDAMVRACSTCGRVGSFMPNFSLKI